MGPKDNERKFYKTGNHRCDGSTGSAQRRQAELAEDKQVIQHKVCYNRSDTCDHRTNGFARFAQR